MISGPRLVAWGENRPLFGDNSSYLKFETTITGQLLMMTIQIRQNGVNIIRDAMTSRRHAIIRSALSMAIENAVPKWIPFPMYLINLQLFKPWL